MSDDKGKGASGAADDTSVTDDGKGDGSGGTDDQKVSHKTYQKVLSEAKAAKERARIAEEKAAQLEQDKLAAEGNKDELIKKLTEKSATAEKKNKDLFRNFAQAKLSEQVKIVALAAGCIDANAVMKIGEFGDVEIDAETFQADQDQITEKVNALKKSAPYLFSKTGPKVNSKMPNGKSDDTPDKPDLKKKSLDDLYKELEKVNKQERK